MSREERDQWQVIVLISNARRGSCIGLLMLLMLLARLGYTETLIDVPAEDLKQLTEALIEIQREQQQMPASSQKGDLDAYERVKRQQGSAIQEADRVIDGRLDTIDREVGVLEKLQGLLANALKTIDRIFEAPRRSRGDDQTFAERKAAHNARLPEIENFATALIGSADPELAAMGERLYYQAVDESQALTAPMDHGFTVARLEGLESQLVETIYSVQRHIERRRRNLNEIRSSTVGWMVNKLVDVATSITLPSLSMTSAQREEDRRVAQVLRDISRGDRNGSSRQRLQVGDFQSLYVR